MIQDIIISDSDKTPRIHIEEGPLITENVIFESDRMAITDQNIRFYKMYLGSPRAADEWDNYDVAEISRLELRQNWLIILTEVLCILLFLNEADLSSYQKYLHVGLDCANYVIVHIFGLAALAAAAYILRIGGHLKIVAYDASGNDIAVLYAVPYRLWKNILHAFQEAKRVFDSGEHVVDERAIKNKDVIFQSPDIRVTVDDIRCRAKEGKLSKSFEGLYPYRIDEISELKITPNWRDIFKFACLAAYGASSVYNRIYTFIASRSYHLSLSDVIDVTESVIIIFVAIKLGLFFKAVAFHDSGKEIIISSEIPYKRGKRLLDAFLKAKQLQKTRISTPS
jgi:hypothetical protein